MVTQTLLDLVTKLPFSEVPRKQHNGKECLNQKALQVEGDFNRGDAHPHYEGIYYKGKKTKDTQAWWTAEMASRAIESNKKYYKDNWDARNEYRKKHRERTRANVNRNYANNKAPYIAKRNARRKHLKENIKLTKTQRSELNELHRLRLELDLAAVGAGEFPEGYNGQTRWSFELHHLMPLTENKEVYLGLDAAWNVEILSVADHKRAHSHVSPSER